MVHIPGINYTSLSVYLSISPTTALGEMSKIHELRRCCNTSAYQTRTIVSRSLYTRPTC